MKTDGVTRLGSTRSRKKAYMLNPTSFLASVLGMRCLLQFGEDTKEITIAGDNIYREVRIAVVKTFDIDVAEYDIMFEGVKITKNFTTDESDPIFVITPKKTDVAEVL